MNRYRLTESGAADIVALLRDSRRMFGPIQVESYAGFIRAAIEMVADQPDRAGSWDRRDIAPGIRSFHVEHATGRRGAASHMLFYRCNQDEDGIVILRVLHQGMDAGRHVGPEPVR